MSDPTVRISENGTRTETETFPEGGYRTTTTKPCGCNTTTFYRPHGDVASGGLSGGSCFRHQLRATL